MIDIAIAIDADTAIGMIEIDTAKPIDTDADID